MTANGVPVVLPSLPLENSQEMEESGAAMPHATFWFSRPFKDWIGQRSLTLHWEGQLTVRDLFQRLADEHPAFRANVALPVLDQEAVNVLAAVIMDGNILSLESKIRDGAAVDILLPLTGGDGLRPQGEAPA